MPAVAFCLDLPTAVATEVLGAALAGALPPAPPMGLVLHLQGELGAGKTTCVRSLLRRLGVSGLVRSPTYTLLETYIARDLTCVHLDLYRLSDERQTDDLGLRDLSGFGTLLLIEWPERGGARVPQPDVGLSLVYEAQARRARLRSFTDSGHSWLQLLADDTSLTPYVSNKT